VKNKVTFPYLTFLILFIFIISSQVDRSFAALPDTAQEGIDMALFFEQEKKYHIGLELVTELIEKFPENYDLKTYRCVFLQNSGYSNEDVKKCLDEIVSQDPTNLLNLLTNGTLYFNTGDYEIAKEQYKKAFELHPYSKPAESRYYSMVLVLDADNKEYVQKLKDVIKKLKTFNH